MSFQEEDKGYKFWWKNKFFRIPFDTNSLSQQDIDEFLNEDEDDKFLELKRKLEKLFSRLFKRLSVKYDEVSSVVFPREY